ncbi:hypothetical protein BGZ83_001334 [Gryganskiella cystojenkinii]|nr:hypothetical protein BGZ83_001334 [Gryganskiella cystojenkinii]
MPRLLPVKFTFPFPPYDQPFPTSVQVTGNFEDWTRTHRQGFLRRNEDQGQFETELELDLDQLELLTDGDHEHQGHQRKQRKIVFKFVLDGHNWVTDPSQPIERDQAGNLNNVRFVEDPSVAQQQEQQQSLTESATTKTLVDAQETYSSSNGAKVGDARPYQDISSAPVRVQGDEHDGDGDYGMAIVQNETVTVSRTNSGRRHHDKEGEARPTIDASVAVSVPASSLPSTPRLSSSSTSVASSSSLATSSAGCRTGQQPSSAVVPTSSTSSVNAMGSVPISPVKLYGDQVPPSTAAPTTAISTLTPQLPSSVTLASDAGKSDKHRKPGFWKKFKEAFF